MKNVKHTLWWLWFLASALAAQAQQGVIDSFNQVISRAASDTAQINLLNKRNVLISRLHVDSGIIQNNLVIRKSAVIPYPYGEASARVSLATNYCIKGQFAQAKTNLQQALNIFIKIGDSTGICDTWSGFGMLYGMQGKYDSSITSLEKAIAIAERNHLKDNLPVYYGNIAIGHQMQSDFRSALYYQQKSLDLAKLEKDQADIAYTSLNMGLTYSNMGDTVRAKKLLTEALNLAIAQQLNNVELYAYSNLADLYTSNADKNKAYNYALKAAGLGGKMGDQGIEAASFSKAALLLKDMNKLPEAQALARKAISIADSSGQNFNRYQSYAAMGSILKFRGNCGEAIPYFEKSIAVLDNSDVYNDAVSETYASMSDCYEAVGNYNKALGYFKTASAIADSVNSLHNIRKATELTLNYEFDKKQEAQRLAQERKDIISRARQNLLLLGLALTLALAFFVYRAFRTKQRSNAKLELQKAALQSALSRLEKTQEQLVQAEKMASLGELTAGIAHEIQNPLNFVNNFAEVSGELLQEMEAAIKDNDFAEAKLLSAEVLENMEKIHHHGKKADDIVKSMLQHSRISGGHREPADINKLAEKYLRLAYHNLRAQDPAFSAEIETHFDETLPPVEMVPQDIGQVLLNLLNNAFFSVHDKKISDRIGLKDYVPTVRLSTSMETDRKITIACW